MGRDINVKGVDLSEWPIFLLWGAIFWINEGEMGGLWAKLF